MSAVSVQTAISPKLVLQHTMSRTVVRYRNNKSDLTCVGLSEELKRDFSSPSWLCGRHLRTYV
jgi:hypothetical protein